MSGRLARLALALYPLAYRHRYGVEMEALVEDGGGSAREAVDLARGAFRAHLRPEVGVSEEVDPGERLRLGSASVLLCWVVFVFVGLALYKTTEGRSLEGGDAVGMLGPLHLGIEILAAVGSLAVLVGAAPLVLAALHQVRARPEVRRAAALAGGSVVTFLGATSALVLFADSGARHPDVLDALVIAAWSAVALGCGTGCVLAARRGLFAIEVPSSSLRLAAACAAVVTVSMAGIVVSTLAYLVDLIVGASDLASTPNGPLGNPDTRTSLVVCLSAMVAVVLPAGLSVARTRRAFARCPSATKASRTSK